MNIGITTEFPPDVGFEKVETTLRDVLKENGFGILTEIDVKATLKEKLDLEKRPYKILGACNPPRANQALEGEADIGLLLPCNVVVYEKDDGTIRVAATKPTTLFELVGNPEIEPVAKEVDEIMEKVIKETEKRIN